MKGIAEAERNEYVPKYSTRKGIRLVRVRLEKGEYLSGDHALYNRDQVALFAAKQFGDMNREFFMIFNMDVKMRAINMNICSVGTIDASFAHPSEIFKSAILSNASGIIMVHNHPSGILEPSAEDIAITKRIAEGGNLMGIRLIDSIIVQNVDASRPLSYSIGESNPEILKATVSESKPKYEKSESIGDPKRNFAPSWRKVR